MANGSLRSQPLKLSQASGLISVLTCRQRLGLEQLLAGLQGQPAWSGDLPVALLDRCWLRLEILALKQLAQRLPPDATAEAPELVHYRHLLAEGIPALEAQERCWHDFGLEACQQAQVRFWRQQDLGNQGWTLQSYLDLIESYRQRLSQPDQRALPVLILARAGSDESHQLTWIH